MIYQVRANLYFNEADEAADFFHDCHRALLKSIVVNPDSKSSEFALIELLNNNHDQDPNQPCELVNSETNQPV